MASFYLFRVRLHSAFLQPSTSVCITFPETFKRGVCPRVSLPWLPGSVSGLLCHLHDSALSQRAGRKVSAAGQKVIAGGRSVSSCSVCGSRETVCCLLSRPLLLIRFAIWGIVSQTVAMLPESSSNPWDLPTGHLPHP